MIALAVLLAACSLPAASAPTPSTQQAAAAYTAAAQTIVAELTRVAQSATPLPSLETGSPPATTETPTQPESSPTPTATATPTSQPSPSPTPTESPEDPRLTLGKPDFSGSFESAANWSPYTDEHVSFEVKNKRLVMTAFEPESWDGWMLSWPTYENSYLELVAEAQQCSGLDRYGLVARAVNTKQGYTNYLFGVSCDGRYSLRFWDGEEFDELIDWTESEHLNAGPRATNRLGLYTDGKRLALYANGRLLEEIEDDSSPEGKFGVFVGSAKTEDFTVRVEEISAWDLD
jgi:hypothetical protein